jgi:two-component system, OmpR family, phosphate regulon sensor histidine kinase PhoR
VTRGLFFSFFIRMTIALAFVALMRVWFTPRGWIFGTILVLAWAAINAFLLSRSVRQSIALLQTSTSAIPDRPVGALKYQYSDFDGLAQAISLASGHVERVLMDASESRRELEAMIDSMQDAVVAVDQAGRIQWTNQRMQRLIPGTSVSSAVRIGHALVQTIRDPDVLACVKTALEDRVVTERRSTSLLPGRIFEVAASPMPG